MISLSRPYFSGTEHEVIRQVLDSHWVMQGPKVEKFEADFAKVLGIGKESVASTSNGTSALQLALLALKVAPGDFVLTVSHSFIATANAVRLCGAIPIFVDIAQNSLNIDCQKLQNILEQDFECREEGVFLRPSCSHAQYPCHPFSSIKKTGKLAAILVVHQLGTSCDIESLLKIKKNFSVPLIEDAACAIGSSLILSGQERPVGSNYADAAIFSFHPRKIVTMGEGGVVTSPHPHILREVKLLRSHGQKFEETIDDYVYPVSGLNCRLTDIQAALGIEQLKLLPEILRKRREVFGKYIQEFNQLERFKIFLSQDIDTWNIQSFVVDLELSIEQSKLINYLKEIGIASKVVCHNAHEEKSYPGPHPYSLVQSEKSKRERILLPFYPQLTDEEISTVVSSLKKYEKKH